MKKNRILCLIVAGLTLALASCNDQEPIEYNFNARMEQPTSTDSSKVYLQDERYIYWELSPSDKITIAGDQGLRDDKGKFYEARLIDANTLGGEDGENFGAFNGVFVTTMQWGSQYFLGIYPQVNETTMPNDYCSTSGGSSDFGTVRIYLPTEQGLRTDDKGDITFNNNVWPMVAWYGGTWDSEHTAYNLDFHAVGAIVRVQLYNSTAASFTLDSIEFISRNNATQLSGIFKVNNYKTENPDVDAESGYLNDNTARVAIANKNGTSLGITFDNTSTLRSFYVVLPAYKGRHESTTFEMTMVVHADGGTKTFSKNLTVTTRRNGITYLRAVGIDSWESGATGTIGLVGNGTADRPFKVYTTADLQYLRDCYNSTERKINNQPITAATEIRIMRSDIELHPATWTEGINHFVGHMSYTTTGNTDPSLPQGILNNSGKPLFSSIDADGHVTGITVKCDTTIIIGPEAFTPFCETNSGELRDCRIMTRRGAAQSTLTTQTSGSTTYAMGGICIQNNGTIIGCGCIGKFNVQRRRLGGICYSNNGVIKECYVAGPMTVTNAADVAGICHDNSSDGQVIDCYYSTIVDNANFNMGGIVFTNRGRVEHCYTSETGAIISTGSVGGIVNTNATGGLVNYCWSEANLTGSEVGLIAAKYTAGTIVNCFCNNPLTTVTLNTSNASNGGGGLIGEVSDGTTLENCYAYINKVQRINNIGVIGGLVGTVSGTTARIKNCYVYESASGSTVAVGNYTPSDDLFDNCYIVNGTQEVTGKLTSITNNSSNFDALKTNLNGYTPWGSEWKHWNQSGNTPPTLEAYTQSAK